MPVRRPMSRVRSKSLRDRTHVDRMIDRSDALCTLLTALQTAVNAAELHAALRLHLPNIVTHKWVALTTTADASGLFWRSDDDAAAYCHAAIFEPTTTPTCTPFFSGSTCTDRHVLNFLTSFDAPTARYAALPLVGHAVEGTLYVADDGNTVWHRVEQQHLVMCAAALQLARTRLESELQIQRLIRNTRLLDAVRTAIAHTLDLDVVLRQVVEQVAATYGYSLVSLYLIEADYLHCSHQVGYDNVIQTVPLSTGIMARAIRQRQTIWVENIATESEFIAAIPGIVSEIAIPLQSPSTIYGVLNIEATAGQQLNSTDVEVLESVGLEVSVAIERALLYTATSRQTQQLAVIEQLRAAIASQLDARQVGETVVRSLQQVLQFEFVSLWMLQGNALHVRAYVGEYERPVTQLPLDRGLIGQCIREMQPVFAEDVHVHPAYLNVQTDIAAGMYIPLSYGRNVLGVLCIESRTQLSIQDFEAVTTLREQIAAAVEQSCRFEAAHRARERESFISQLLVATNNVQLKDGPKVWSVLVQRLGTLLEADHCVFSLFDQSQPRQLVAWSVPQTQPINEALEAVAAQAADQPSIEAITSGQRFFIDDLTALLEPMSYLRQTLLDKGVRSLAAVPVVVEGTASGAIVVMHEHTHCWNDEDVALLESVAQHLAVTLRDTQLRRQEVQRRQELEIVYQIAIEINGHHDLEALLQTIVARACLMLNADSASLYLLTPNNDQAELRVGLNLPRSLIGTRVQLDCGLVGSVIQSEHIVHIPNYRHWQQRNHSFDFADYGAVLGVPLVAQQRVVGVIVVAHLGMTKQFRDTDQRLMELLAAQAAQAIETTQLLERVRRRTVEMEALYANALALSADQEPDQVLRSIVDRAQSLMGAVSVGLHLVDDETGDLVLKVVTNAPRDFIGARLKVGEGVAGRVAQLRATVIIDDYQQWQHRPTVYANLPWSALMGVPMLSGDKVVGVLGLAHIAPDKRFTADDQQLMELFASQGVQVVEHARRFERERVLRADAENSLQEMKAVLHELEHANEHMARIEKFRMLGELASEVAHDFNNALVSILGNTQFLLLDETEPERMDMLRSVEAAARDSVTMIKRIQEFGRSQSNLHKEQIDINVLVRDALTMTQSRWRDHVEPTTMLRAQRLVAGNSTELRRVLMNLIVNALDAMPHGGTLKICTYDVGAMQCIEVQDTGMGMLEHVRARIFDPFFTTKAVGMGTGLGLSICQQIITQHGGTIEVRSEVGTGTTFTIQLPADNAALSTDQMLDIAPPFTALVCEPEGLLRAVIERFFEQQGYVVTIAETTAELQQALANGQWDVVIVDSTLGKASLRQELLGSSFVVVLSNGTSAVRYKNAHVVLSKPIDIAQLHQIVAKLRSRLHVAR